MLHRVIRLRCPACGKGHLFRRYFVRKDLCGHCGWEFERGHGHWVGGSEVHMFASYGLSIFLFLPVLLFADPTPALLTTVIVGHLALSLLLHRYSRALFLAVDYLVDPADPPQGDDGEGGMPMGLGPDLPANRRAADPVEAIEA